MSWWTAGWLVWFSAFAALEGAALLSRAPRASLSDHVWDVFRVRDPRPTGLVIAARVVLGVFGAWLTLHMSLGWFTLSHPVPW